MPTVTPDSALAASRGGERQYCFGAGTLRPSAAAACHGQRGSHNMARASATRSASPSATIASACCGSVINPTAIVTAPVARRTARASGTW